MAKIIRRGKTCSCGPVSFLWMLIAAAVYAVGTYVLVMAVQTQWLGVGDFVSVAPWYAVGFVILLVGKITKWKAVEGCEAHKN